MSPKSLFIIIVRIIGLFLLIDVLRVIPQGLKVFGMMLAADNAMAVAGILISTVILLLYYFVVKYTLFKAEKIVERFSLDKNFSEEKFELNIHHSSVIKIAVICIGGYLFIENFVPMILEIYTFVQNQSRDESVFYSALPSFNYLSLVHYVAMVLIGYYMLGNSKAIANFIELKRRK